MLLCNLSQTSGMNGGDVAISLFGSLYVASSEIYQQALQFTVDTGVGFQNCCLECGFPTLKDFHYLGCCLTMGVLPPSKQTGFMSHALAPKTAEFFPWEYLVGLKTPSNIICCFYVTLCNHLDVERAHYRVAQSQHLEIFEGKPISNKSEWNGIIFTLLVDNNSTKMVKLTGLPHGLPGTL